MSMKNVSVRMDEEIKKKAEELFEELGLNMSTAINMFVRQALNQGGIPFKIVKKEAFYNDINQKILLESIRQFEEGYVHENELIEVD